MLDARLGVQIISFIKQEFRIVQVNLILTLSLEPMETDYVLSVTML